MPVLSNYHEYKQYLRKDFYYSCAYCTITEWKARGIRFEIDHYEPVSAAPHLRNTYTNLMYSCEECNSQRLLAKLMRQLKIAKSRQHVGAEKHRVRHGRVPPRSCRRTRPRRCAPGRYPSRVRYLARATCRRGCRPRGRAPWPLARLV